MKTVNGKKGVSLFAPILALLALGIIGFGLLKLASAPKITEQGVGDIQASVIAAIANVENTVAYHEQLAAYSHDEAILTLGSQAGISQTRARECKRGTYYIYSDTCKPTATNTYTELFMSTHNKKLEQKTFIKTPEETPFIKAATYTYTLSQNKDAYVLIAKANAPYSIAITNKPDASEKQTFIGGITADLSYQIPIEQNFNDYDLIYTTTLQEGNCLSGKEYKNCLKDQHDYAWTVGDKDSGGFIPIRVVTNTKTKYTNKPLEITFYADPLWLKNTKP